LLAQLLDGHPELHSHPPELVIGPAWPTLDMALPAKALFKQIKERHLARSYLEGYWKDKPARQLGHGNTESFPFDLDPNAHRALFLTLAKQQPPVTQRDVLDLYFAALFTAWPGNRNRHGNKRWTVAFRGRLRHTIERFFVDYPDGRHITIVRDAKGVTASKFTRRKVNPLDTPIANWNTNIQAAIGRQRTYGADRVAIVMFDRLITDTEATMRKLAAWLGVRFDPILLTPTFNREPIKANSSWKVDGHGILPQPLTNWRNVFTDEQAVEIDARTGDLYQAAQRVAL
jgi:hypothetical protein